MRGLRFLLLLSASHGLAQDSDRDPRADRPDRQRAARCSCCTPTQRADGSWQVTGEYLLLPTLARRFLEGERSPQLGVTVLKEGTTPILFGRPATGELRGTWRERQLQGRALRPRRPGARAASSSARSSRRWTRYSANVRCEAKRRALRRRALRYAIESGKLKSLEWRSKLAPGGQACTRRRAGSSSRLRGGLRFVAGGCSVTLRDARRVRDASAPRTAPRCAAREAYLEPLLVDRRGTLPSCCAPERGERMSLGNRHRHRDPRAALDAEQDLLRRVDRVRRAAEHAGLARSTSRCPARCRC